jgi:hypothetical protein
MNCVLLNLIYIVNMTMRGRRVDYKTYKRILYQIELVMPETSKTRLRVIKGLLDKKDIQCCCLKWKYVHEEVLFLSHKNSANVPLKKYFKKNPFMKNLIQQKIEAEKLIDSIL